MNNKNIKNAIKNIYKNYKSLVLDVTALSLVLNLLSSCGINKGRKDDIPNPVVSYMLEDDVDNTMRFYKENGVNVKKLSDGTYYVTSYSYKDENVMYAYSNLEFREITGTSKPTFNDVKKAIEENTNINGIYEEWLNSYVSRLAVSNPNIDLSVFYYNIKTFLGFVDNLSLKDINEGTNSKNVLAYFSPKQHKIYLSSDYDGDKKTLFEHELTHLLTEANLKLENQEIIRTNKIKVPVYKEEESNIYINDYGTSLFEGSVDLFLMENNMLKNVLISSYEEYSDIMNLFLTYSLDSVTNIYDVGPIYFYENMYNAGIHDLKITVSALDEYLELQKNEKNYKNNIIRMKAYESFMRDAVRTYVSDGKTRKDIYEMLVYSIENGFILKQINLGNKEFIEMYESEQKTLESAVASSVHDELIKNNKCGVLNVPYDDILSIIEGNYDFVTYEINGKEEYKLVCRVSDGHKVTYCETETLEQLELKDENVKGEYIADLGIEYYDEYGFFALEKYKNSNTKTLKLQD